MVRVAIFITLLLIAFVYAWWRGGGPERATATAFVIAYAMTWLAMPPLSKRYYQFDGATFVIDLTLFACLFLIMIRANRDWPIVMCALAAIGVLGHLAKLIDVELIRVVYKTLMVFWGWLALIILLLATHAHQRRLRRLGSDPSWRARPGRKTYETAEQRYPTGERFGSSD